MGGKGDENILDIEELERSYYADSADGKQITYSVLKGLSFQVKAGEFIGIMGTSGCGKTTLLKTLGMLDLPTGGNVRYKGAPANRILGDRLAKIRRTELAFVFQDFYLMDSLTVKENIMMPLILNEDNPEKSEQTAVRMAKQFGIGPLLNKKPYELSGGEKQRTAICRAMAADPELILADEPTGNLDSKTSQDVLGLLKVTGEKFGQTIVMITHNEEIAQLADRIVRIEDGRIVKGGERDA